MGKRATVTHVAVAFVAAVIAYLFSGQAGEPCFTVCLGGGVHAAGHSEGDSVEERAVITVRPVEDATEEEK